jgi:endonuclease YncB( thermonuclease family)
MAVERRYISTVTLACAAGLATCAAGAQTRPRGATECGADNGSGEIARVEVARVVDGRSFLLADGREVRLAGIETLLPVPGDEDEARVAAAAAARSALEAFVRDRDIAIRSTGSDRYGRLLAYVFVRTPSGEILAQRELVAAGHALLSPAPLPAPCRASLREAERTARAAELGLWGDPYYVLKMADNIADVLAEQGRFAVVGGKVASVRESGGIVYVNFGRRWSQDFTVTILKRNERMFTGAGLTPKALAGRYIEVRGWIEERGGPAIEAARPEQIEIIN